MSPLAFDKQGKPFSFQRRTKKLLVRLFRNPSARGTCCQVLGADGQALYIDPETDYVEFRRAVGQVPGLYRLDQCDDDGNELDDAQPAYVSIDVARNAQTSDTGGGGDVNPLVIIQQMAAIQADVMKTMAAQQAALLAATAEILRAPYRPAPVASPATEIRNVAAIDEEDDELEQEVEEEEAQPESTLVSVARMVDATMPNMAAHLGEFLYEKIFEALNKKKKAPIAVAAAAPVVAPAAPSPAQSPTVPASTVVAAPRANDVVTRVEVTTAPVAVALDAQPEAPTATEVTLATTPVPTPAQMAHLVAIRERLDAKERAIAEAAIQRMTSEQLGHWLAELSEQSVDDATATIRDLIAQIRKATPRSSQP